MATLRIYGDVMDIQTKETLIAEIEQFKKEALKMHIVQVLADSYTNTNLFDHNIDSDGSVIWYKAQARQLWDFWQAAKAQAVPESNALLSAAMDAVQKLGGGDFVLVPKERLANVVDGIEKLFEEDCTLTLGELLPIQQDLKAIIEAQEQSHD